jgi:uncharacterized protein (DUF1501 family)
MATEMNRRDLLRVISLIGACGLAPFGWSARAKASSKVLVLLELNGGNDSLNTFVPLSQFDQYKTLRPALHLRANERVKLDDAFAMHNSLAGLIPAWQDGDMALVHGLGYETPNLSHFRSIEIWDTASKSDEYGEHGWLASGAAKKTKYGINALVLGRNAGPVTGLGNTVLQAQGLLKGFVAKGRHLEFKKDSAPHNAAYAHLLATQNTLSAVAKDLLPILRNTSAVKTPFPDTQLGKQLAEVALLISSGVDIPVYKVALSGFDTHRNQKAVHQRLLGLMGAAVSAFRQEMIRAGKWDDVVLMTYSEFGRRPKMNGSGGTDHGTAATHLIMGGKVKGGHIGEHPILPVKDNANMQFTTDFKALYQTILDQWFPQAGIRLAEGVEGDLPLFRNVT